MKTYIKIIMTTNKSIIHRKERIIVLLFYNIPFQSTKAGIKMGWGPRRDGKCKRETRTEAGMGGMEGGSTRGEGWGQWIGCVSTVQNWHVEREGHKIFQNGKVGSKFILEGNLYQLSTTTISDVVYHRK